MNAPLNMEELSADVARRWDGHSPARNLVRDYGRQIGFPLWFTGDLEDIGDNLAFFDNTEELIDAVQEILWGDDCKPVSASKIGKKHVAWA